MIPEQHRQKILTYLGEYGHLHWLHELNVSDDAFSAMPLANTAGARAQSELMQHDGISSLENFNVAYSSIGDMSVYSVRAMPIGSCSGSTCDCLGKESIMR